MATINKDFKIKSGLIVEGTTATVNGFDILTKSEPSQDFILDLIGGETLVKSVEATQLEVNGAGKLSVKANVFDSYGSAADAQSAAESYADGLAPNYDPAGTGASAAGSVASDLTDHENATVAHGATGAVVGTTNTQTLTNKTIGDTLNFVGAGAMTINSDSHIVLTPAAGSSVKWGSDVLATQGYADQAEADAITAAATAAGTAISNAISTEVTNRNTAISTAIGTEVTDRNSAIATAKAQAIADANSYTDGEVAALVSSAPELLDTLAELATAIAENPNYATDAANAVAGRVAKSGDTMTGDLTLPGAPTLNLHAATKGYVDSAAADAESNANLFATGEADAALSDANEYTDAEIVTALSTAQGYATTAKSEAISAAASDATTKADAAEADANTYTDGKISTEVTARNNAITTAIDLLSTSDIEEGSNKYFTDARAKESAAALLTGATKTNITITGTGAGLTITAENGVADSTTSDLAEGSRLYFTNERAVDALEAVVPNFTAVELNSVAKQVAATLSAPTAGIQTAHAFAKADYRSAEYLVKVAYGTHTEISKVLLTLDSSDNIAITEYGIVGTNGSASTISAGISGANVQLLVTTANNNSTVTVMGTLLK